MLFVENIDTLPPLHLAAFLGDLKAIQAAIDAGADINGRTDTAGDYGVYFRSLTPLMVAAGSPNNTEAAMQLLLNLGADPFAKSKGGTSALWYAASADVARLQLLLSVGGDPLETADNERSLIIEAASVGNGETVQLLLSLGVSPNPPPYVTGNTNSDLSNYQIPLFCAAKSGDVGAVQALLNAGASCIFRDSASRTALFYAGSGEVVAALLNAGCPLDTVDRYGFSELDSALDGHMKEVVHALVVAGASLKTTDTVKRSPLTGYCSSHEIDAEMVQLLIDLGADVHERIYHQRTALHQASQLFGGDRRGKLGDVIKVLVKAGIPVDVLDKNNETPLHLAVGDEGTDISAVEALLELGADINARNAYGETPLMVALSSATHPEHISLLLAHGADPRAVQLEGQTVLDYALKKIKIWQQIVANPGDYLPNNPSTEERHRVTLVETEQNYDLIESAINR